eukprot:6490653-Amphidinium_carterae.1
MALLDSVTLRYLEDGDRRGAQDHLRSNRRAIRNRYQELLEDGQGSSEQLRRFVEAKARRMPWADNRTTRFIVYGEDPAMAAEEPGVHVAVGLGVPALLSTHPSQLTRAWALSSPQPLERRNTHLLALWTRENKLRIHPDLVTTGLSSPSGIRSNQQLHLSRSEFQDPKRVHTAVGESKA